MIVKIIETDNGHIAVEIDHNGLVNTFDEFFFVKICKKMILQKDNYNKNIVLNWQIALNKLLIYKALRKKCT